MKKVKRVLVVTPFNISTAGGVQSYVKNIYSGLASQCGLEVIIVTSKQKGTKVTINQSSGIKIYQLPELFKISNTPINPAWLSQIKEIISNERPQIVNAHAPVPFMAEIASIASGKIPFILTYHTGKTHVRRGLLTDAMTSFYENFLVKFIFSRSDHIIAASDFVVHSYLKNYLRKTSVVTPGVDVNLFKPGEKNVARSLLFVGSLTKAESYKGLEFLIEALALIKQKYEDLKLIVVGDGDRKVYYQSLCRKRGLTRNVVFCGRLNSKELAKKYQKASVFVHPSMFDNFPLVLLEAMASCLPIVATRVGSIPDVVKHNKNGFLVPPGDADKLAKSIIRILEDNSLANSMAKAGYEKVRRNYSWSKQIKATHDVFRRILS